MAGLRSRMPWVHRGAMQYAVLGYSILGHGSWTVTLRQRSRGLVAIPPPAGTRAVQGSPAPAGAGATQGVEHVQLVGARPRAGAGAILLSVALSWTMPLPDLDSPPLAPRRRPRRSPESCPSGFGICRSSRPDLRSRAAAARNMPPIKSAFILEEDICYIGFAAI